MDLVTKQFGDISWLAWLISIVLTATILVVGVWFVLTLARKLRIRYAFKHREYLISYNEAVNAYNEAVNILERFKTIKSDTNTIAEIIERKKVKFRNITGVYFHFVDKDEVTNFYNDTFKEPTIESLVTEMAGELTGEIKGGLPKVLESKLGGKDLNKWISTIKLPDTSLPGMFARYQREAIKRGEVTLGLEELDIELNQVDAFKAAIENLNRSFGFTVAEDVVANHHARLKQEAAATMVAKLEAATGWILMEGKFRIETRNSMYKCVYVHPVNEFISSDSNITISFMIPASNLEPRYAGNYAQSVGREIPMRVFGKVWQPINSKSNIMDQKLPRSPCIDDASDLGSGRKVHASVHKDRLRQPRGRREGTVALTGLALLQKPPRPQDMA